MTLDKVVPNCDVSLWDDVNELDKVKLQAKASVDPVFFWNSPVMGNIQLWPSQVKILNDFYSWNDEIKRRAYNELLLDAGRRGGKTTVASVILLTEAYKLLMMKNPQRYYGLIPGDKITLFTSASSVDQTLRTIFPRVRALLENSPWFMSFAEMIKPVSKKIDFPKNVVLEAVGSNLKTAQGRTIKCYVAEEINSVGNEDGKITPEELYDKISKGTASFIPYGEDVRVAISSQTNEYDFLSQRIRKTVDEKIPRVLVIKADTLELNPNLTKEDLETERLRNEDSYNLEFGLGEVSRHNKFFTKSTLERLIDGKNMFSVPEIVSVTRDEEFIPTFHPTDFVFDKYAEYYYMSVDPAVTKDPFGIAVMHKTIDGNIVVDGCTVFRGNKRNDISPSEVKKFVEKILDVVPVQKYIYDIYQYSDIREMVADRGIEIIQHHLAIADWEQFKDQIGARGVTVPLSEYIMKEFRELIHKNSKVDHPPNGTKDMLDAVCNGVTEPFRGEVEVPDRRVIAGITMKYR